MTTLHSPGPWEWVGRDLESNFPGHCEAVIESTVSCGSFCYGGSVDMKISDADRRLIAAAPDLLEALRDMLSGWRYIRSTHGDLYGVGWDRAQEKAESAIAKVEGA